LRIVFVFDHCDHTFYHHQGYLVAGPCSLPHPDVTAANGEIQRLYVELGATGIDATGGLLTIEKNMFRDSGIIQHMTAHPSVFYIDLTNIHDA
jgi:hypothetical protein